MARPLTGRRSESNGRYIGDLPRARGAPQRVRAVFSCEADRDDWLSAGVAALSAGGVPPDPVGFRRGQLGDRRIGSTPSASAVPALTHLPTFEELAHGWLDEYYGKLKNADAERARDARIMVERHLIPAFAGPIPGNVPVARARLIAFVRRLALEPEWEASLASIPGADPNRLFTIGEAIEACGRSQSTVRRALRAGRLPGARRGGDGQWRIPASDLLDARLLGGAAPATALSRAYATDILWVHAKILEWGRNNGWDIPDFARGVHALTPDDEVARRKQGSDLRRPLSIAEVARVASHLHVVHQLALWLMRILGLRISEAFGPRVGDIVDLDNVGLVFVTAQGGRPFLIRSRSGGVVTRYSKHTLKRAASYRVIVVPPALMAVVRVATEAFHTDPTSGEVDFEARLVPWITKEDRGQTAFRAALDDALNREGFGVDASGLEITTHDLRKSLATDLAWNAELDELVKRRVMGHKAGDDVFARVYTLDHPTIAPLAAVAHAVEADINLKVDTLMVPTERRVAFGSANPMRARSIYADAVLAEAGWQVEPGDASNPWCDTSRVMAELGVAATTARRWMRDQVVPSTVDTDRFGNPTRRARLLDVQAVAQRLASRTLLRDVAGDIGVGYHLAWHTLQRLAITPSRDPRTDEMVLEATEEARLRAEFERLAALKTRSLRLSAASTRLGVAVSTVRRFVHAGQLDEDPETDPSGARYVTRESVDALLAARARRAAPRIGSDVVSLATATRITGLSPGQISELTLQRVLERSDISRRFHVTVESLRRWTVGYRPDLTATIDAALSADGADDEADGDNGQPLKQ